MASLDSRGADLKKSVLTHPDDEIFLRHRPQPVTMRVFLVASRLIEPESLHIHDFSILFFDEKRYTDI